MHEIRPLHDRVMIRRVEEQQKSAGGIIIPDSAKEKATEGEVVSAGSGEVRKDGSVRVLDVKVGDRVLFGKHSATDVLLDGEERLILRENEILGVLQS